MASKKDDKSVHNGHEKCQEDDVSIIDSKNLEKNIEEINML